MSEYDISVIVPIYNAEKYIRECIDSILHQTKDNIEIILVNDGCTDTTPDILREYEVAYDNIRVISQENGGLAAARITGLKHAIGKYVGWVDADDFIKPEMYSVLYRLAEDTGSDYVYCDYEFYPGKVPTKEKWFKKYNGIRDWNFIERNTQCWNTLTKKALLDKIDLPSKYEKFEEYAWIAVMLHADKIEYTEEKLYFYRVGEKTMSGGTYEGKLEHFEHGARLTADLKQMIVDTEYENKLDEYFSYRYIYTLLQVLIVAAVNSNHCAYKTAKRKLNELNYVANRYTKMILDNNHGKLKSFIIRNIIPSSYFVAKIITKSVL